MRHSFLPWAVATLLLLGDPVALEESGPDPEEAVQLQIINFNFETVWVTWNASEYPGTNLTFSYKFRGDTMSQCHNYTLDQGYTSGCVLEVEPDEDGTRDVILELSLCNKTRVLLNYSVWISEYLKPSSPKDLTFLWRQETVTVRCSNLSYNGLLYQIQYKSNFDSEWESTERRTCSIAIENLDTDKCYYFRARVKTMESRYGPETYPSDWSEVTQWRGGEQKDTCLQEETSFPRFVLIAILVTLLTVCVLLLFLWKRQRVKNLLMPSVPDPKFTFPGLFEDHRGNFQEWIKFTENVAPVNKVENEEEDCALEEVPVVQLVKAKVEAPMTGPLCPQMQMGEALGPGLHPLRPPQHSDVVTLGGFSFVVDDDAYLML
ncbi:cytokine receptor-like factor 2 [Elephas maximus indicus]|uniref:cytokine receptor-like factor 2 n=1 Tax=Elephas maximus indicus TaxID=99487 RepID=UPI0021171E60|nr:cytokine receptor-like factor 2 [Elephas maximus indicus]